MYMWVVSTETRLRMSDEQSTSETADDNKEPADDRSRDSWVIADDDQGDRLNGDNGGIELLVIDGDKTRVGLKDYL